jgi:hypothetical protein
MDTDGNGKITFKKFKAMLAQLGCGLKDTDVMLILMEADQNGDGVITLDEFEKYLEVPDHDEGKDDDDEEEDDDEDDEDDEDEGTDADFAAFHKERMAAKKKADKKKKEQNERLAVAAKRMRQAKLDQSDTMLQAAISKTPDRDAPVSRFGTWTPESEEDRTDRLAREAVSRTARCSAGEGAGESRGGESQSDTRDVVFEERVRRDKKEKKRRKKEEARQAAQEAQKRAGEEAQERAGEEAQELAKLEEQVKAGQEALEKMKKAAEKRAAKEAEENAENDAEEKAKEEKREKKREEKKEKKEKKKRKEQRRQKEREDRKREEKERENNQAKQLLRKSSTGVSSGGSREGLKNCTCAVCGTTWLSSSGTKQLCMRCRQRQEVCCRGCNRKFTTHHGSKECAHCRNDQNVTPSQGKTPPKPPKLPMPPLPPRVRTGGPGPARLDQGSPSSVTALNVVTANREEWDSDGSCNCDDLGNGPADVTTRSSKPEVLQRGQSFFL